MILKAYIRGTEIDLKYLGKRGYMGARVIYACDNCGREGLTEWRKLRQHGRLETQLCMACAKVKQIREDKENGLKHQN